MCNAYTNMWAKLLPSSNTCGFLWWRNIDVHGYVGRHVGSSYQWVWRVSTRVSGGSANLFFILLLFYITYDSYWFAKIKKVFYNLVFILNLISFFLLLILILGSFLKLTFVFNFILQHWLFKNWVLLCFSIGWPTSHDRVTSLEV